MKNKVIILGTLVVALLGVIAFTTTQTDAYRGDYTEVGPNHTEGREAEMEEIFESKDYNAWVEIMTEDGRNPGIVNKIDEEDFDSFVEARELAQAGDTEAANEIREELGLGQGGMRRGQGNGTGKMARDGNCNL